MKPQRTATCLRRAAPRGLLQLALALVATGALAADGGSPVGQIGFVIGDVAVVGADGQSRPVQAGADLFAGDRIVTAAGQHVHLRFVDGGFVSVRPGSHLTIARYETQKQDPAIRFELEHGVVRSITGKAVEQRKDRFRLDTPVAAIGVRGTDFVVHAQADAVRALVNQGAIVVAPYSGDCSIGALGACGTADAVELAEGMGRVALELRGAQPARLLPLDNVRDDKLTPAEPREPLAADPLAVTAESSGARVEDDAVARLPVTGPAPDNTTTALRWGRWQDAARPGDQLSALRAEVLEGRDVTVGNRYAALYRAVDGDDVLSTQLATADFRLAAGEVVLQGADGQLSAGRVDGGRLQIDFARRRFDTGLSLWHAQTGAVALESGGRIRSDGIFAVTQAGNRVAGAVAFDGSEAGYLFDTAVAQGVLTGTTLWKR